MPRFDRRGRRLGAFEFDQSRFATLGQLIDSLKVEPTEDDKAHEDFADRQVDETRKAKPNI